MTSPREGADTTTGEGGGGAGGAMFAGVAMGDLQARLSDAVASAWDDYQCRCLRVAHAHVIALPGAVLVGHMMGACMVCVCVCVCVCGSEITMGQRQ